MSVPISHLKRVVFVLVITFSFAASVVAASWATDTWHGTDWIQDGASVTAQKVAENFLYLLSISGGAACTTHNAERIRYSGGALEYCNGSSWVSVASWSTSVWGSCTYKYTGVSIPGNISCGSVWVGPCNTPMLNICTYLPGIKNGDKFRITTSVSGSHWVHGVNTITRTAIFTKGVASTDYVYSDGTYRSGAYKRNHNWRIYNGGCIVYGRSQYIGGSSNYKRAAIKITALDRRTGTQVRAVQCSDGSGNAISAVLCSGGTPTSTQSCAL